MVNKTTPVATPEMLNAIRDEASAAYQDKVPVATPFNLQEVGNPIINYEAVGNEFIDSIINKIVAQLIIRRMWENPLAILRRDTMPLGWDIEENHVNPAQAQNYDGTEVGMAKILKMEKPDVATVYYRLNRQDMYQVTINNDQLRAAFTAWSKMEDLIAGIVDSLYTGNTIDEYKYTKQLISDAIANNRIIMQNVANPVDDVTGKNFMAVLRGLSMMFTFPSTSYNSYQKISGKPPRMTWSPIQDQIILIRGDVASKIGVEVLSTLFNVEYADYIARNIVVDNFGDETTLAVLADRNAFLIMEQLRQFRTFYNGASLGWQYFYHAWDLFSLSPFHNMVALTTAAVTP